MVFAIASLISFRSFRCFVSVQRFIFVVSGFSPLGT